MIVSQLINPSHKGWDCHKLRNLFDEQTVKAIQRIPISFHSQADKWIWTATSNGKISVKSAYWLGRRENRPTSQDVSRAEIWKTKIHERLKMHLWRFAANCFPTKSLLTRYINIRDTSYSLCGMEEETCLHLFVMWPLTKPFGLTAVGGSSLMVWVSPPPPNSFKP